MAKRTRRKTALSHKRRQAPGTAPGTLSAPPDAPRPIIHVIAYDADSCDEQPLQSASEIAPLLKTGKSLWVDVQGVGDAEEIRKLGELFNLHLLSLEDVLNLHQRPKVECFENYIYCVLRMPELGSPVRLEQMSVFLGKNFVITVQEDPGDPLDPVRDRLRQSRGRIRGLGSDYLAYAILDAIVDHYFPVMEAFADRIDELEDSVLGPNGPDVLSTLQGVRRDLLLLRRAVWPLREMLGTLAREECSHLIDEKTAPYLRDCQDHAAQLADVLESCRELSTSLMDTYLSSLAVRTNEVMRVLTIMSTIFIPLTFIAGIYGMNFDPSTSPLNMPELRWTFGYPFSLGLMAVTAIGLLYFFRRKGWL